MGKRTLVEYSQIGDDNFVLCRRCRTHIALTQEFVCRGTPTNIGFFRNVVNLQVDGSAYYHRDEYHTSANVYCYICDSHLGWKFIEVVDNTILLNLGRYILFLLKLLIYDGTGILLDANTNEQARYV